MVATSTVIAMAVNMLLGLILPAVIYFMVRKHFGGSRKAFFTGCGIMFVFAFVLESFVHGIVLGGSAGNAIMGNIWLYGLYGGLMAAVFEETGRFVAFRFLLKSERGDDANAWMYGAGHGGFEAFYILFISGVNNLLIAALMNSGMASMLTAGLSGAELASVEGVLAQMQTTSWGVFALAPIERVAAMIAHLSFSVFVWFAVKEKKPQFYGVALLLHFTLDFAVVIVNSYLLRFGDAGTALTEVLVWAMALGFIAFAWRFWKAHKTEKAETL